MIVSERTIPFDEERLSGKPRERPNWAVGPCICKTCGAYIPTGHYKCLACGEQIVKETAVNNGGVGLTPPKTIKPPPPPPLRPKAKAELDMDDFSAKTIRVKVGGDVKTYRIVSEDSQSYKYPRTNSEIKLVLHLKEDFDAEQLL